MTVAGGSALDELLESAAGSLLLSSSRRLVVSQLLSTRHPRQQRTPQLLAWINSTRRTASRGCSSTRPDTLRSLLLTPYNSCLASFISLVQIYSCT